MPAQARKPSASRATTRPSAASQRLAATMAADVTLDHACKQAIHAIRHGHPEDAPFVLQFALRTLESAA